MVRSVALAALVIAAAAPPVASAEPLATVTRAEQVAATGSSIAWTQGGRVMTVGADGPEDAGLRAPDDQIDLGTGPGGAPTLAFARCARRRCAVHLYDLRARRERRLANTASARGESISLATVWGDRVVYAVLTTNDEFALRVARADGGRPRRLLRDPDRSFTGLDLRGTRLAIAATEPSENGPENRTLSTLGLGQGRERLLFRSKSFSDSLGFEDFAAPTVTPGGQLVVLQSGCDGDAAESVLRRFSPGGEARGTVTPPLPANLAVSDAAFAGGRLLYASYEDDECPPAEDAPAVARTERLSFSG